MITVEPTPLNILAEVQKLRMSEAFEQARRDWEAILQPHIDEIEACQRISAEDLAVTINAR